MELKRRYHRKQKIPKLKLKLSRTKDNGEKQKIPRKILRLSPWWKPVEAKA